MKIYITNRVLTEGILVEDGDYTTSKKYIKTEFRPFRVFRTGKDVFLTPEEAIEDANKRRDKKVRSLQSQIMKLRALRFTID